MNDIIDMAYIQVQDLNGGWFTARTAQMVNYQYLINEMHLASGQFPGKRIKAVDKGGRLIDML